MEDYKLRDLRASHTLGWSGWSVGWFVMLCVGGFRSFRVVCLLEDCCLL